MSQRITQAAKYKRHLEQQLSSGLSIKAYCARHGLNPHTFSYYRSRSKFRGKKRKSSSFIEAKIHSDSSSASSLGSRVSSRGPLVDPIWLGQFVRTILEVQ